MKTSFPLAVFAGFALLVLPACTRQEAPPPEIIRPVVTLTVPEPGAGRQRTFSGTVRAAMQTPLSFRVAGEIIALPAKRGMAVKAGDLIAQLDPKDYDLQVKQAEAQHAQAAAQAEQARAGYERARQLYETRNISKSELEAQEAAYKSAVAQQESTQKGLEMARQQVEYCTLKAPVSGSLASVPVEIHQTISAGQTVADLSSGEGLELEVGIPESLIGQIEMNAQAVIRFEAIPKALFNGVVSEVGIEAGGSSVYPIKVRLEAMDARIRMGMVGEATFSFKAAGGTEATLIPSVAVVPSPDGRRFVWVVDPATTTVARREIQIGALTSEGLEVLEGLKPGEHIVIRGVNRIEEGKRVRLLNPS